MEVECGWCFRLITDERDQYEIEPLNFFLCEECMTVYINGPYEKDDVDEMEEELKSFTLK